MVVTRRTRSPNKERQEDIHNCVTPPLQRDENPNDVKRKTKTKKDVPKATTSRKLDKKRPFIVPKVCIIKMMRADKVSRAAAEPSTSKKHIGKKPSGDLKPRPKSAGGRLSVTSREVKGLLGCQSGIPRALRSKSFVRQPVVPDDSDPSQASKGHHLRRSQEHTNLYIKQSRPGSAAPKYKKIAWQQLKGKKRSSEKFYSERRPIPSTSQSRPNSSNVVSRPFSAKGYPLMITRKHTRINIEHGGCSRNVTSNGNLFLSGEAKIILKNPKGSQGSRGSYDLRDR